MRAKPLPVVNKNTTGPSIRSFKIQVRCSKHNFQHFLNLRKMVDPKNVPEIQLIYNILFVVTQTLDDSATAQN